MARSYTYRTSLSFGGDEPTAEFDDVVCTFSVDPPSGDGWNEPRDPGGVVDVTLVSADGRPADSFDDDTVDAIENELELNHYDRMLEEAAENDAPDPDRLRDERTDRELMERF